MNKLTVSASLKIRKSVIGLINCRTQLSGGWIYVVYYIGINYMFRVL